MLHKMNQLEQLVVAHRQKNLSLEDKLSAAQDRIGGAERKASLLATENAKIQGELQFWNDVYQHDTGIFHPMSTTPSVNQSVVSVPLSIPMIPIFVASKALAMSMDIPVSMPAATRSPLIHISLPSFGSGLRELVN